MKRPVLAIVVVLVVVSAGCSGPAEQPEQTVEQTPTDTTSSPDVDQSSTGSDSFMFAPEDVDTSLGTSHKESLAGQTYAVSLVRERTPADGAERRLVQELATNGTYLQGTAMRNGETTVRYYGPVDSPTAYDVQRDTVRDAAELSPDTVTQVGRITQFATDITWQNVSYETRTVGGTEVQVARVMSKGAENIVRGSGFVNSNKDVTDMHAEIVVGEDRRVYEMELTLTYADGSTITRQVVFTDFDNATMTRPDWYENR